MPPERVKEVRREDKGVGGPGEREGQSGGRVFRRNKYIGVSTKTIGEPLLPFILLGLVLGMDIYLCVEHKRELYHV